MTGINVTPEAKKTLQKTLKKLKQVVAILKQDGWITDNDMTFYHPLAKDGQAIRERLLHANLLTTNKCRISIHGTAPKIEIA